MHKNMQIFVKILTQYAKICTKYAKCAEGHILNILHIHTLPTLQRMMKEACHSQAEAEAAAQDSPAPGSCLLSRRSAAGQDPPCRAGRLERETRTRSQGARLSPLPIRYSGGAQRDDVTPQIKVMINLNKNRIK